MPNIPYQKIVFRNARSISFHNNYVDRNISTLIGQQFAICVLSDSIVDHK